MSHEGFVDAGDSFDPIKLDTALGDRSGKLRVLTGVRFFVEVLKHHTCILLQFYFIYTHISNREVLKLLVVFIMPSLL